MPIQFEWQPARQPVQRGEPIGLLLGGDDPSIGASTDGRVRLVEVAGSGASGGAAETRDERLVAVFRGRFHRDPTAPTATRLTFEILRAPTDKAHEGSVFGFDPECMFGVDFVALTFVNRQFIVWFPFHTDVNTEGDFLELQAIAETGPDGSGAFREFGRSMVRTLANRESVPRTVETTSTNELTNTPIRYNGRLAGYSIAVQEDYLLGAGTRNAAQSTPDEIVLDQALVPAPRTGPAAVQFAPYTNGAMQIVLMTDLLDELLPDQTFAKAQFPGQQPAVIINEARTHIRSVLPQRLVAIFVDAGFQGAAAIWQDEAPAAQLVTAFTTRFIDRGARGGGWKLRDDKIPFVTNFWNFFVVNGVGLTSAARSEAIRTQGIQRDINNTHFFLRDSIPVGSGTKKLEQPVRIAAQLFQRIVTTDSSNRFRQFPNLDAFRDAVDVMARKVAAATAHEVAHTLGMMHTVRMAATGTLLEDRGAPVLTVTSEDLRSHVGRDVRFSMQAKNIWATVFGVTPSRNDTTLLNKTWQPNEVPTVTWFERITRFQTRNGEPGPLDLPKGLKASGTPPFAVAPPGAAQRGTR